MKHCSVMYARSGDEILPDVHYDSLLISLSIRNKVIYLKVPMWGEGENTWV